MRFILFCLTFLVSVQALSNSELFFETHCLESKSKKISPVLSYDYEGNLYTLQKSSTQYKLNYWENDLVERESNFKINNIRDFIILNNSVWILTYDLLREYNLNSNKLLNEYSIPAGDVIKTKAKGIAHYQNQIYIAQNSLGVREFNLENREFTHLYPVYVQNKGGKKSIATDITFNNDFMYVAMATTSQGAFTGVAIFNMQTKKLEHLAAYNYRKSGVLDNNAKIYINQNKVYLNNGGWVHTESLDRLHQKKKIAPKWLAHSLVDNGVTIYSMIRGDLTFKDNTILGCSSHHSMKESTHKAYNKTVNVEISL